MSVDNNIAFIGQLVKNSTIGAPLTVDANQQLISGLPTTTYVGVAGSTTVATSASYATMASLTITPAAAGTYQVSGRSTVTHATNNADIFMAVHVAGTIVSDSISQARPFIQGGVTPSLSIPMILSTFTEVAITVGQAITIGWRTSAGTATSANSRAIMILRIR